VSPLKVLVLASGSGSLFQALIDNEQALGIEIVGLITDGQVGAIVRAREALINERIIPKAVGRDSWDEMLYSAITEFAPDLVVSAGFMRIIRGRTLEEFEGRIINTHPALLPAFPGAHAVRDALAAGVKKTGASIHFIDAGVDTGEIIAQREVAIEDADDEATLHERIKVVERELLVETVGKFARGELKVKS
jgi:phosphoribosylglycinamide formyltransferase-1